MDRDKSKGTAHIEKPEENTTMPFHDSFLDGNEILTDAIKEFYEHSDKEHLAAVLDAIRKRMHEDGHFVFPVFTEGDDDKSFTTQTVQTGDGKVWQAAFTSQEEFGKGAPSKAISNFINVMLKGCLRTDAAGIVINPWGQSFLLTKELMEVIFRAEGEIENVLPDRKLTPEDLQDGSLLKKAIHVYNNCRTERNLLPVLKILRDSLVWIPCNAVMSDADYADMEKLVKEAEAQGRPESLIGKTFSTKDVVRMIPDILQKGEEYFFPVFAAAEDMGEYGNGFSKLQKHFLEAMQLAKGNEKNVTGIVINAFSEPFVLKKELFDAVAKMEPEIEGSDK